MRLQVACFLVKQEVLYYMKSCVSIKYILEFCYLLTVVLIETTNLLRIMLEDVKN